MAEIRTGAEVGGFVLVERIGSGGMGEVWAATEGQLGRKVALKLIRTDVGDTEEMRQRFILEARSAAAIEHPNVVPIYQVGNADDVLFIAMRFVNGPSLDDVLNKEVFLEPERAVSIVSQVASALEAAHEIGFVHRDVKPANILLANYTAGEHAYLVDFGLARFVAQSGLTRSGQSIGTPSYMSPEQVRGEKNVDGRADIYALGCVLFRALTGDVPYPREETHAVYFAHLDAAPPSCSECNSSVDVVFDEIVYRAMAKRPEDRFASASELGDACRSALSVEVPVVAKPTRVRTLTVARTASASSEPVVLVWQRNAGSARIHVDGACTTLAGSVVPPQAIRFAGPGTAGWLTDAEAMALLDAVPCGHCMAMRTERTPDERAAEPQSEAPVVPDSPDAEPGPGMVGFRHDRGGRDTVFELPEGQIARTGAAGTRCFRDIAAQFSEAEALATAKLAIELMPEVDRVTPKIRRPQVSKGEIAVVAEALLVAGGVSHDRAHEIAQRVYRSGKSATADLRAAGFRPPTTP
jgi:hypothetical protein